MLTGHSHVTALIPACFGLVLLFLSLLAQKPTYRMHAMHAAVGVALLGLLATGLHLFLLLRALPSYFANELAPAIYDLSAPKLAKGLMALLCLVYILISLGSFVRARVLKSSTQGR